MRLRRLSVLSAASILASVLTSVTPALAQSIPPDVLKALRDPVWTVRCAAVRRLTADWNAPPTPAITREVMALLDRENKFLRDPGPRQPERSDSDSDAETDAYAYYYSDLLGYVVPLVDPGDERSVGILVRSGYNPDSTLAIRLASYGRTALPALLEINSDPDPERRSDSYELLGQVLRHHRLGTTRYPLTKQSVGQIESRLRAGLRDAAPVVRMEAIQGVKVAGDLASLPVLQELSTSDPFVLPGTTNYFIREQAAKAIAAIQANPLGGSPTVRRQ